MKKILLFVIVMTFLTGCQDKTIKLNNEVRYKGWKFKLTNVEFSNVIGAGHFECESTTKTFYDFKGLSMDCLREVSDEGKDFIVIEGELKYIDDTKASLNFDLGIDKGEHYKSYIVDNEDLIFVDGEFSAEKNFLSVNNPKERNSFKLRSVYVVNKEDNNFIITMPFGYKYKVKRN